MLSIRRILGFKPANTTREAVQEINKALTPSQTAAFDKSGVITKEALIQIADFNGVINFLKENNAGKLLMKHSVKRFPLKYAPENQIPAQYRTEAFKNYLTKTAYERAGKFQKVDYMPVKNLKIIKEVNQENVYDVIRSVNLSKNSEENFRLMNEVIKLIQNDNRPETSRAVLKAIKDSAQNGTVDHRFSYITERIRKDNAFHVNDDLYHEAFETLSYFSGKSSEFLEIFKYGNSTSQSEAGMVAGAFRSSVKDGTLKEFKEVFLDDANYYKKLIEAADKLNPKEFEAYRKEILLEMLASENSVILGEKGREELHRLLKRPVN